MIITVSPSSTWNDTSRTTSELRYPAETPSTSSTEILLAQVGLTTAGSLITWSGLPSARIRPKSRTRPARQAHDRLHHVLHPHHRDVVTVPDRPDDVDRGLQLGVVEPAITSSSSSSRGEPAIASQLQEPELVEVESADGVVAAVSSRPTKARASSAISGPRRCPAACRANNAPSATFSHRHRQEGAGRLLDHCHTHAAHEMWRSPGDIVAVENHPALVGSLETNHELERVLFPAPLGTDEARIARRSRD